MIAKICALLVICAAIVAIADGVLWWCRLSTLRQSTESASKPLPPAVPLACAAMVASRDPAATAANLAVMDARVFRVVSAVLAVLAIRAVRTAAIAIPPLALWDRAATAAATIPAVTTAAFTVTATVTATAATATAATAATAAEVERHRRMRAGHLPGEKLSGKRRQEALALWLETRSLSTTTLTVTAATTPATATAASDANCIRKEQTRDRRATGRDRRRQRLHARHFAFARLEAARPQLRRPRAGERDGGVGGEEELPRVRTARLQHAQRRQRLRRRFGRYASLHAATWPVWARSGSTSRFGTDSRTLRKPSMADAAPPAVPHRTVVLRDALRIRERIVDKRVAIVTLVDRRPSAPSAPREWLFQVDLEDLLYPSVMALGTAGAFYRLLKRSAAGNGMAMPLRRTSIAAGLITEAEFNALKALLHVQVRVFTLVPMDAVEMALATYGRTPASVALMDALGLPHPQAWEGANDQDGGEAQPMEEAGAQDEAEGEEEAEEEERNALPIQQRCGRIRDFSATALRLPGRPTPARVRRRGWPSNPPVQQAFRHCYRDDHGPRRGHPQLPRRQRAARRGAQRLSQRRRAAAVCIRG